MRRRTVAIAGVLAALALLLLGITLGITLGSSGVMLAGMDPAQVKARIVDEVQRATGRSLGFRGDLRLTLLPELTVSADDVALANPPGFSRPAMLTARTLHARIALLPLLSHHVVVRDIVLTGADLKLERRADGVPNWHFSPGHPAGSLPETAPPAASSRHHGVSITILGVSLHDAVLSWTLSGQAGTLNLDSAELREVNASSTIHLAATASLAGDPVTLEGRFGGQSHLWNAQDRSEWPVQLSIVSPAGRATLSGSIAQPRRLAGYDLAIAANGPDLGRLAGLWPALPVPRLRDARLSLRMIDQPDGDGIDIPRLALTAGASDLGASVQGLALDSLSVDAPNIDGTAGTQPNHVRAAGHYAGQALQIDATLGPIGRLFGRGQTASRAPITVDAIADAAGARLMVHGKVAPSGDWGGTDATLQASIPDLAALSPLAGRTLPRLAGITLAGTVQSARGVLSLRDAHLVLPQADIMLNGTARLAGRPSYDGTLAVARFDLDGLRDAWPAATAPPAPAATGPQLPASASEWVIPDTPVDFGRLQPADADIKLTIGHLVAHRTALDGVAAHLKLRDGRLDIDPVSGQLANAAISGRLSIASRAAPPDLALDLHAAALDIASLLAILGLPPDATGHADLDAELSGSGATLHAIAGTLKGHAGLALTDGSLANRLLSQALAALVPVARIGLSLPQDGSSAIACLATRMDLNQGVAVPRAFLLDTSKLRLSAAGAIDLRGETFALRLHPYVRLGPVGLVLPSRADGSWRDPRVTLEPASGAPSTADVAAGLVAQRRDGSADTLGALMAGLAGSADSLLGDSESGDCGRALAVARDSAGAIAALPEQPAAPPSRRDKAIDLLRRLFKVHR